MIVMIASTGTKSVLDLLAISISPVAFMPERTPVPAAKEFLDESYLNNPVINIPSELLANHEFIMDLGENESKFQNIWTQFKLNR